MNEQNCSSLCKRYPKLYREHFYFECGDGWYGIINRLSEELNTLVDQSELEPEFLPIVSQVKEKYGTLRYYINLGTDAMYEAIEKAESESETACEVCGEHAKLKPGAWYKTLCIEHWER